MAALSSGDTDALGHPLLLLQNPDRISAVSSSLNGNKLVERDRIIEWLSPAVRQLALDEKGCRLVQGMLELKLRSGPVQINLLAMLAPHIKELYESPHGNYVLTKVVELLPADTLDPVLDQVRNNAATIARHRFGCRVLERLIEHCSVSQMKDIINELVAESEALCRHPYGNFVVQHILEHGSPDTRRKVLVHLLPTLSSLAMHRTASHSVQKALDHCGEEGQGWIVAALLYAADGKPLIEVAASRYGSFVAEQLVRCTDCSPGAGEVRQVLLQEQETLTRTSFGARVLERFNDENNRTSNEQQ